MDFGWFEAVRLNYLLTSDSKLDDDFVDRLNRYWTALLMILFAIVLSAKQVVGDPLKCWTPLEFKPPWIQYAEDFCWVKNTYFVPKKEELAVDAEARKGHEEIGYYQWIPYMMTVQAFLYYLPAMVWRLLNWKSGLDLSTLVSRAGSHKNHEGVAYHLNSNLRSRSANEWKEFFFTRKFLTCLYLTTKTLYSLNAVGQFFLLSSFFGRSISSVFLVARDLALGVEWHESGHFPRVSFCDFPIRTLGNVNSYTLQCVLTINIFTEKIFVFAGFWMLLVACLTVASWFAWTTALLLPWRGIHFLARLAPLVSERRLQDFLDHRLGHDGLLVMHLVATNSDDRTASQLLDRLLADYEARPAAAAAASSDKGSGIELMVEDMEQ